MPRIREDSRSLLADLQSRLARLVDAARREGRDGALSDVRALVAGGAGGAGEAAPRRGPGRPRKNAAPAAAKPRKRRKNPWASMTPEQKADRVRKMLAGRGLKPKSEK